MHDPTTRIAPPVTAAAPLAGATEPWQPQDRDVSPGVRFVELCGRRSLPPALADQLRELGAGLSATEWQQVLFAATAHGMAPLVFLHAAQVGLLASLPPAVAGGLGDSYRQTLVTNRGLQREQETILSALAARGVAAIPVKGITLAARYYGDLAVRPIHDIDLLVRRGQVRQAGQILKGLGYAPLYGHTRPGNFAALLEAELSYARDEGAKVELHWELTQRPAYRGGLPASAAWRRTQMTELHGRMFRQLSASDELRFLCAHCTVDHPVTRSGIRMIWLVDIVELVQALPGDWDWPGFIQETIALGLAAPVAVALAHCQALLDLDLPPEALEALRAAAATPEERTRWRTAQTNIFSADGLRVRLGALRDAGELATFLRGVLLPSSAWIRKHYGRRDGKVVSLLGGYLHYFSRLLVRFPELFGADRLKLPAAWRLRGWRWPRHAR